jgi:hypothetical protein
MGTEMTRDEHEDAAREVSNEALRKIRDEFQAKHSHYVPPPWAMRDVWDRWVEANCMMHGVNGFHQRGLPKYAPEWLAMPNWVQ